MVNKQTNAMLACATAMERTTDKLNDLMKESMKMVQMLCNFTDKELETKRDRAKKSELEAERKNEQDDPNIKANRVNSGSRGREYRCHRCSGLGHWEQQCPWKEKGMWDCYKCKKMTDHKASDHEKYPDRFRKCESKP
ncbi:uncharacterized protein LOC123263420 [Cotesia glomerata]|uniref:uncharacterized protein LOC123263420 n=1 Tax=Cotesia glomerata TaxID=32391 RepID=UPI001D02B8C3|nr:uncharacterized protein LOC123263420 [Cotesia glomerata]